MKNKFSFEEKENDYQAKNSQTGPKESEPKNKLEQNEKTDDVNNTKTKASISKCETEIDKPYEMENFNKTKDTQTANEMNNTQASKKVEEIERNNQVDVPNESIKKADEENKNTLQTMFYMSNFNHFLNLREQAYQTKNLPVRIKKKGRKSKKKKKSAENTNEPLYQFWYDCPVPFKGNLKFKQILNRKNESSKFATAFTQNKNSESSKQKKENRIQLGNKFESDDDSKTQSTEENKCDESTVIVKKVKIETIYTFSPFLLHPSNEKNEKTNQIWFDCPVPFKGNFYSKKKIKKTEEYELKLDQKAELIDKIRIDDENEMKLLKMNNRCCLIF